MSIFSLRSHSSKTHAPAAGRGFTLIELLVTVSIMVIITSLLMVRQSRFNSSTLLRSLAYSVALSVRQAQVYGTSAFGTTTSNSTVCGTNTFQNSACFVQGYGVFIDTTTVANPTTYILFADLNNNGTYDTGEDVKTYSLGNGYSIAKICVNAGLNQYCSSTIHKLSILFRRPNPDACFTTDDPSLLGWSTACAVGGTAAFASSSIQVQANGGDVGSTRSIFINTTGQITIGNVGT